MLNFWAYFFFLAKISTWETFQLRDRFGPQGMRGQKSGFLLRKKADFLSPGKACCNARSDVSPSFAAGALEACTWRRWLCWGAQGSPFYSGTGSCSVPMFAICLFEMVWW